MSTAVRDAFFVGIVLALISLGGRVYRHRNLHFPFSAFLEIVAMVIAPLPVPALVEIIGKVLSKNDLPIFNDTEQRVAILLGTLVLLGAIVYAVVVAMLRAWEAPAAR